MEQLKLVFQFKHMLSTDLLTLFELNSAVSS